LVSLALLHQELELPLERQEQVLVREQERFGP